MEMSHSSEVRVRPSSAQRLRTTIQEAAISRSRQKISRQLVLAGAFSAKDILFSDWKNPPFKLVVFLSSTFTDTQLERGILMDELLFPLRQQGLQYGIQVIFMDMRWGVQDQKSLDHNTWNECAKGVQSCKEESMGIAFFSLQGDKSGYTPLPKTLSKEDLDLHLTTTGCSVEVQELIHHWYTLDDNAIAKEYVLRNLTHTGDAAYWKAFEQMLPALRGLCFDKERYGGELLVGKSVTEYEVRAAVSAYPVELNRETGLCWSHRQISGEINDKDYCDVGGESGFNSKTSFDDLLAWMRNSFPESVTKTHDGVTLADLKASVSDENVNKIKYLEEFRHFSQTALETSLQAIIKEQNLWDSDGGGLGMPGVDIFEMLHHCEFAHHKCNSFVGRQELIDLIIASVQAPHREVEGKLDSLDPVHCFLGIAVSVIGVSGAGKTALMAKAANVLYHLFKGLVAVIIRFCGTSAGSNNARSLMMSVCAQMEQVFSLERKASSFQDKAYDELVSYFHHLLHEHPVLLFIDSLDQLRNEEQGRSEISFLKRVKPHSQTRIVVSSLPDEKEINPETGRTYMYLCETRLKVGKVPRVDVMMSKERAVEEAMDIVVELLSRQGRCLQETQLIVVRERISQEKEKTALYISLAVDVISKWTSSVDAEANLKGGVLALIDQLFSTLELDFGKKLVQTALAFLTYSVKGVSDSEMVDLLSLDDEVLDSVFQYHKPTVWRLPSHVWLRLKGAMEGLVTEGEHGCFQWYHRQLKETAERRFALEKLAAHTLMANYFGNLVDKQLFQMRQISRQGWTRRGSAFDAASVVNVRRCSEATYHMLQCGMWRHAEQELCDFAGICCKLRVGEGFQLVRDLVEVRRLQQKELSVDTGDAAQRQCHRVHHYIRWLRQDMFKLLQRCLPEFTFAASAQPKASLVRDDVYVFLEMHRTTRFPFDFPRGRISSPSRHQFDALLGKLEGHSKAVYAVAFSPNGLTLATASADLSLRLWDVATGEEMAKLEGHRDSVRSVSFSPDGLTVASSSYDKTVRLWDVTIGQEKAKLEGHLTYVSSASFSPDGLTLVSASSDNTLRLWDVNSGEMLVKFEGHSAYVMSVAFSPDGLILASGSYDKTVRMWNVTTAEEKSKFEGHSDVVKTVSFSPDGLTLASCSYDNTVRLWDVTRGELKAKLEGHGGKVFDVSFSPNGLTLASSSSDKTVRVWDLITMEENCRLEGHKGDVTSVAFSPDGHTFASGSGDNTVCVWDVTAATEESSKLDGHSGYILSVAFSPDGLTLVSGSVDKTVRIGDVATGAEITKLEGHSAGVTSVSFSPNGLTVASGSVDKAVYVWNVATGQVNVKLEGHSDTVTSVAFSPDGLTLASGSTDKTVRVWDVISGTERALLEGDADVKSVAFSPDGRTLATGSGDSMVCLWEVAVATGAVSTKFEGHSKAVSSVLFSPDGLTLASGSVDKTVLLWDVITGEQKVKLEGHSKGVMSVSFSPDGLSLASGSRDKTVRVWDVSSGRESAKLEGHVAWVMCVAFRPDGLGLASGSYDKTVRMWDVAAAHLKIDGHSNSSVVTS